MPRGVLVRSHRKQMVITIKRSWSVVGTDVPLICGLQLESLGSLSSQRGIERFPGNGVARTLRMKVSNHEHTGCVSSPTVYDMKCPWARHKHCFAERLWTKHCPGLSICF